MPDVLSERTEGSAAEVVALKNIDFEQKLNSQLPIELTFSDESGRQVHLADYLKERPAILVFAYYRCPRLCSLVLQGAAETLSKIERLRAGSDYQIVVISINPDETPQEAAEKKASLAKWYFEGSEGAWHFLTGSANSIQKMADAAGFRYRYDPATQQFLHAAGFLVLTPGGKTSHYFYGLKHHPQDLRLALVEAADGRIGSVVEKVMLFCAHVDLTTGKYSANIFRVVQIVCGFMVVMMLGLIWFISRSKKSH